MMEAQLGKSFRFQVWFVGIMTCGIGALLLHHAAKSHVYRLDVEGVTLRNGKSFAWADLESVRPVYAKQRYLNHVSLVFKTGTVGLFFRVFDNGGEVLDFVRQVTGHPIPAQRPVG